jgi:hypothetical protein
MEQKLKYLKAIEIHLKKIDKLYAGLTKAMLDKISDLETFDLSVSIRFIIDQHVYLEQVAAHLVVISDLTKRIDVKYLNKYLLKDVFEEGELANINILAKQIIEKIGFMNGLRNKAEELLAKNKVKASWRIEIVNENHRLLKRYFKKPFFNRFFNRL